MRKREERFTYVVLGTITLVILLWFAVFHILVSRPFDKMFHIP